MPLANFFDKAALAASHVLRGFDYAGFAALLESRVIGIAYERAAWGSPEGRVTLELLTNLLARLYPSLCIVPLDANGGAEELEAIALSINPEIRLGHSLGEADTVVVVGNHGCDAPGAVFYIGSNGWLVSFSSERPVGSGGTTNPIGAAAAACFGAANVFRCIFREQLEKADPDSDFTFSMLDFASSADPTSNPPLKPISLDTVQLIGLGAIGNGAVWALSRVPGLTGALHLIDHEPIELTNLQRYVLTTQGDVGRAKVELAVDHLRRCALDALPFPITWGEYLHQRNDWNLPHVAVAVDSAETRCAIQGSLPGRILNAWTQPGDLGVSRHVFSNDDACLVCLYMPNAQRPSDEQVVAEALGMADKAKQVGHLLFTGQPVPRELVAMAAERLKVPVEPLLPYVGKPLAEFYSQVVCGGIVLSLQTEESGGSSGNVDVPLAFQSAFAGVLLATEIVAEGGGLRIQPLPTTTRFNLLRPLQPFVSFSVGKAANSRCICQDEDYRAAYQRKYSGQLSV